jgi:hypothetical protein
VRSVDDKAASPLAGKTAAEEAYALVMSYLTRPASGTRSADVAVG